MDEDEFEMNDDLTDLTWLTTFNLSKQSGISGENSLTLSPPKSPPSPLIGSYLSPISVQCNDDETDSHKQILAHKKSNSDLAKLLKPIISTYSVQSPHSKVQLRPNLSFSYLTFIAIECSERKRLSVKEIYSWIIQNFPYYGSVPSGSWKNSIRHNLSFNRCFSKVDKNLLAVS